MGCVGLAVPTKGAGAARAAAREQTGPAGSGARRGGAPGAGRDGDFRGRLPGCRAGPGGDRLVLRRAARAVRLPHSELVPDEARVLRPPDGIFVLVVSDGKPVACGGVQSLEPTLGEIKRMWVLGSWRGAGLGSRLLGHLEARACGLGHVTVRLDTNQALTEAIAMYYRAGYRAIDRYNDNPYATHFFEKSLS